MEAPPPPGLPLSGWGLTLWSVLFGVRGVEGMEKELVLKRGCQDTIFLFSLKFSFPFSVQLAHTIRFRYAA